MSAGDMPAGKPTQAMNSSFSGFDYMPGKLDKGRGFLMDDYLSSGRVARRNDAAPLEHLKYDTCKQLVQYQTDTATWQPKQGLTETKFHSGFMRRQVSAFPYIHERVRASSTRMTGLRPRATSPASHPPVGCLCTPCPQDMRNREQAPKPSRRMAEAPPYHDVITGEGITKNVAHGERRHVEDHGPQRGAGLYADAPGGRLRDSTARFFCTPDQMPHRPERAHLLHTDGLIDTKRTSTVIGVGTNPSQEIYSVGAREALQDSLYGLQRRQAAKARESAADAALVQSLR